MQLKPNAAILSTINLRGCLSRPFTTYPSNWAPDQLTHANFTRLPLKGKKKLTFKIRVRWVVEFLIYLKFPIKIHFKKASQILENFKHLARVMSKLSLIQDIYFIDISSLFCAQELETTKSIKFQIKKLF